MDNLYVIKIGGNIIDDAAKLLAFLEDFAKLPGKKYWYMVAVNWLLSRWLHN